MRRVKIDRGLIEDVRGAHVTWTAAGRRYLAEVIGIKRAGACNGFWMLETRHFNGDAGPTVAASVVKVLER